MLDEGGRDKRPFVQICRIIRSSIAAALLRLPLSVSPTLTPDFKERDDDVEFLHNIHYIDKTGNLQALRFAADKESGSGRENDGKRFL